MNAFKRILRQAAALGLLFVATPVTATTFTGSLDLKDPPPRAVIVAAIEKWSQNKHLDVTEVNFLTSGVQQSFVGQIAVVTLTAKLEANTDIYVRISDPWKPGPAILRRLAGAGDRTNISGRFEAVRTGAGWDSHFIAEKAKSLQHLKSLSDFPEPFFVEGSKEYEDWLEEKKVWKANAIADLKGSWVGMLDCGGVWNIDTLEIDDAASGGVVTLSKLTGKPAEPIQAGVSFEFDDLKKTISFSLNATPKIRHLSDGTVTRIPEGMMWKVRDRNCAAAELYHPDALPAEVIEYREELASRLARVRKSRHAAVFTEQKPLPGTVEEAKVVGNAVEMTVMHPQRTSGGRLWGAGPLAQSKIWVRFADFPGFEGKVSSEGTHKQRGSIIKGTCRNTPLLFEDGSIEIAVSGRYGCFGTMKFE